MDVARALLERVIEQPVADVDDVLIVGVELAAPSQLHQLLEVGDLADVLFALAGRAFDRLGEVEELDDVVLDIERVNEHALDIEVQELSELFLPFAHERLAGRNRRLTRGDDDRQDAVALRVRCRHQLGHRREVDLERINVHIGQVDLFRQPLRQDFESQRLLRIARVLEFLVGDHDQRMRPAAIDAAVADQLVGIFPADELVGNEVGQHVFQREPAVSGISRC